LKKLNMTTSTVFVPKFKQRVEEDGHRVKAVDIHPTEPLILCALYNGKLTVHNYQTQKMVNETTVCAQMPIRAAQFVHGGKILCGADDMRVYLLRMHNMKKIWTVEAHADYIRCVAHHPTRNAFLSGSDDMSIKYWTYTDDSKGKLPELMETFEGHTHYVMAVRWNPIEDKRFASVSLDRVLREWWIESGSSSTTYEATSQRHEGHTKGINCVDYDLDNKSIASGDDCLQTIVWNIESRQPIWTLKDHTRNVTAVRYTEEHLLTASEDGSLKAYKKDEAYKLVDAVNLGFDRCWCLAADDRVIVAGYDKGFAVFDNSPQCPQVRAAKGVMVKFHKEASLYVLKSILAKYSPTGGQIQIVHLDTSSPGSKNLGSSAGTDLQISPDGRYISVIEPTGFTVYNSKNISKSKYTGDGVQVIWREKLSSSSQLMIGSLSSNKRKVVIHNFKEQLGEVELQGGNRGGTPNTITGGKLITAIYSEHLEFYDWDSLELVKLVDTQATNTFWSTSGLLVIASVHSTFFLQYNPEDADGLVKLHEDPAVAVSGLWLSPDVFVFLTQHKKMYLWTRGLSESIRIGTVDEFESSKLLLQEYMAKHGVVVITDYTLREPKLVAFHLPKEYLEAVAMILEDEVDQDALLETTQNLPKILLQQVAKLCEERDMIDLALLVSTDIDFKFNLALKLNRLTEAVEYAQSTPPGRHRKSKFRILVGSCLNNCNLDLAVQCAEQAHDYSTLNIILSLFGDEAGLAKTMESAREEGLMNHVWDIAFKIGRLDVCLDVLLASKRGCEATMFAANYLPERVQEAFDKWQGFLREEGLEREADRLVCPSTPAVQAALATNVGADKLKACSRTPAQNWPLIQSLALGSTFEEKTSAFLGAAASAPQPPPAAAAPEPAAVPEPVAEKAAVGNGPVVTDPEEEEAGAQPETADPPAPVPPAEPAEDPAPAAPAPAKQPTPPPNPGPENAGEAPADPSPEPPAPAAAAAPVGSGETPPAQSEDFATEDLDALSDIDDLDLDVAISSDEEN